jgi:transcription antitermination factor NusG
MWYVLHLFVELDKFMVRYQSLPREVRALVSEMVTLRQPSKTLYQRDPAMFVGYVFVQVSPKSVKLVHEALRTEGIGEVLTPPGSRYLMPLRPEEVTWVYELMRSRTDTKVLPGALVRITRGPFEGMAGTVESIAGQTIAVRVQLRRSVSLAYCTPDTVEAA